MGNFDVYAGEHLEGHNDYTFTCYEGTWTEYTDVYTNKGVIESVWAPSAPIRANDLLKWHTEEDTVMRVEAGDAGELVIGMAVDKPSGNVESASARRRVRVYLFQTNDIIKLQCAATTHNATVLADSLDIKTLDRTGKHGVMVEGAGDTTGPFYVLNVIAADTAGYLRARWKGYQ